MLTLTTCTVDLQRGEVHRDGDTTRLTPKERQLLVHLASRPGEYVARATLLEEVWGYSPGTKTHTLATNVYTLRQKLERDPSNPAHLLARWGRGYCLELPEATAASPPPYLSETSWIGRPDLEEAVLSAVTAPPGLVTLVGPPGAGKTRLAMEVAARVSSPGGVARSRLETVASRDDLVLAVLRALRQSPVHAGTWREHLASVLDERGDTLLVADDTDGLPEDALALLEALPAMGLSVLTTGRRRRAYTGVVTVVDVPPLPTPSRDDPPSAVLGTPGARLLAERARHSNASLTLQRSDAPTVAELLHATGGLPLAIELAAAQLRAATLQEVAEHMASHTGSGLRAVLERSWSGLATTDRDVLATCAWFHGWFSLADATAVVGKPILESLVTLADHSLLHRRQHKGRSRFRMLPPVRQFCRARVDEAGSWRDRIERRHEAAMAALAERLPWTHRGAISTSDSALLLDDLDAARRRAEARGDNDRAGQITVAWLTAQLSIRDPDRHHADLAEQTAESTASGPIRARLHCLAAECAGRMNDYDRVRRALANAAAAGAHKHEQLIAKVRALIWTDPIDELRRDLDALEGHLHQVELTMLRARLARRSNDRAEQLYLAESALDELDGRARPPDELWLHVFLGDALFASAGSGSEALAHYEAALHISQQLPGDTGRTAIHHLRAVVNGRLGRFDEARADHEAAAAIMRRLGQRSRRMYYQVQLANTLALGGTELTEAARLVDEALRYFERGHGHPLDVVVARCVAGEVSLRVDRLSEATSFAQAARDSLPQPSGSPLAADTYMIEAQARIRLGQEEGWAMADRAVDLYRESQHLPAWLSARASRARLLALHGHAEQARAELDWLEAYLRGHPRVDILAALDLPAIRAALASRPATP